VTITEANDINTVLRWAMSKPRPHHGHPSDGEAMESARRLAARANKTLQAGLKPEDIALSRGICSSAMAGVQAYIDMDARMHGGTE
jgi:hypothetical protein